MWVEDEDFIFHRESTGNREDPQAPGFMGEEGQAATQNKYTSEMHRDLYRLFPPGRRPLRAGGGKPAPSLRWRSLCWCRVSRSLSSLIFKMQTGSWGQVCLNQCNDPLFQEKMRKSLLLSWSLQKMTPLPISKIIQRHNIMCILVSWHTSAFSLYSFHEKASSYHTYPYKY